MIGGRLVLPGTIINTSLPAVTENADYDLIANLPGLVHFTDWATSKRISTSPLACYEHVADVAYTRKSGYAGNPSFSTIGSGDAVQFVASSELQSGVNINYAADFSIGFVAERDASDSGNNTLFGLGPSNANLQVFATYPGGALTPNSTGGLTWTNSITGTIIAGQKRVLVFAYKASTRTLQCYVDGVAAGSAVVSAAMAASTLNIGRSALMKIGHLFVFSTNLADTTAAATRSYVTTYLAGKHGITL